MELGLSASSAHPEHSRREILVRLIHVGVDNLLHDVERRVEGVAHVVAQVAVLRAPGARRGGSALGLPGLEVAALVSVGFGTAGHCELL